MLLLDGGGHDAPGADPVAPHHEGLLLTVLIVLLVLTCLTVGVSFFNLGSPVWHIAVGISIAVVKASLVVLFFMHALHGSRLEDGGRAHLPAACRA